MVVGWAAIRGAIAGLELGQSSCDATLCSRLVPHQMCCTQGCDAQDWSCDLHHRRCNLRSDCGGSRSSPNMLQAGVRGRGSGTVISPDVLGCSVAAITGGGPAMEGQGGRRGWVAGGGIRLRFIQDGTVHTEWSTCGQRVKERPAHGPMDTIRVCWCPEPHKKQACLLACMHVDIHVCMHGRSHKAEPLVA